VQTNKDLDIGKGGRNNYLQAFNQGSSSVVVRTKVCVSQCSCSWPLAAHQGGRHDAAVASRSQLVPVPVSDPLAQTFAFTFS